MADHPLVPDVGIIALVADDWGLEWMSRHQILTRLAKYFPLVWLNPAHDWHEILRKPPIPDLPDSSLPPGFQVHQAEFWLPKFYRPRWLADYTLRKRLNRARNLLLQKGCRKIILYIWRPEYLRSLDVLKTDLVCYHIVDEYSFSDVDLPNSAQEVELLQRADQVFVHTRALLQKKGSFNSCIDLIPNGVDYRSFASPLPEPGSLQGIPHPRIGYSGYLKKTLDWNLLSELSVKHPDYSFVFVGAQKNEEATIRAMAELSSHPNVFFLGHVTTGQMPSFPQHFDVCMMPYLLNDYTSYVYPLKLHEYLASGRPVVATPTRLLREFQGTIRLCNGSQEWSFEISQALLPEANSPEAREIRQAVARKHDWDLLANSIAKILCRRLHLNPPALLQEPGAARESDPILSSCS
jgi:glycosyltransferase involved in cell wall biosynthesis